MLLRLAGSVLVMLLLTQPALAASDKERLNALEQQIGELRLIRENLAEQTAAITRLQEDVAALKGALDELRHRMEQMGGIVELENRLTALEAKLAQQPGQPAQPGQPGETAGPSGQPEQPTEQPPKLLTEDEAFQRAKELFKQTRMAEARQAFQKFTADFPASNLVPSAKFWVGETYYYERRFEEAILEYQRVIKDHPEADKVPSALLKQAFAFAELKDTTSAKLLLNRLIKDYPKTQQATIAQKKLDLLKR